MVVLIVDAIFHGCSVSVTFLDAASVQDAVDCAWGEQNNLNAATPSRGETQARGKREPNARNYLDLSWQKESALFFPLFFLRFLSHPFTGKTRSALVPWRRALQYVSTLNLLSLPRVTRKRLRKSFGRHRYPIVEETSAESTFGWQSAC